MKALPYLPVVAVAAIAAAIGWAFLNRLTSGAGHDPGRGQRRRFFQL
jgi:hypothetical protein